MSISGSEEAASERVREEPCKSWEAAREKLITIASSGHRVFFRGQADASWRLKSTLDRLLDRLPDRYDWVRSPDDHQNKEEFQSSLLKEFRKALLWIPDASGLYEGMDEDSDEFSDEFLALAQHYGLPTQLLDWTRSPYIAAFFAFDGVNTDLFPRGQEVAIWSLDAEALDAFICSVYNTKLQVIRDCNYPRIEILQVAGSTNRRLIYQEGLFTRARMVEQSIDEFLLKKPEHAQEAVLRKLVISGSEQAKALRDLSLMSIRPVTLMSDPEGAAATAFNTVVRFGLDERDLEAP